MAKKKESLIEFPRQIGATEAAGHDDARRAFLDAWSRRDARPVHPVWILSGAKGIGKATLAFDLARRVFSDITGRPVRDIAAQMQDGGIGDLFVLDLESERAIPGHEKRAAISVELVRRMIGEMRMSSMGESWRVIIIDSLDDLSGASPANALLKILEEPPEKTIFFLIAHSLDRALPTIRSRARVEKLRPLSPVDLRALIARRLPDARIGEDLIRICGGSFGRIAALSANGAGTLFSDAARVVGGAAGNAADILGLAKRIGASPENMDILQDLAYKFGLSDLYSEAASDIARGDALNLDREITAFKILNEMARRLKSPKPILKL